MQRANTNITFSKEKLILRRATMHLAAQTKANLENSHLFLFQRTLKFNGKPLEFRFQMDSGNVTKLHLDDNWVSNGLNVTPQKHYKNTAQINRLVNCHQKT